MNNEDIVSKGEHMEINFALCTPQTRTELLCLMREINQELKNLDEILCEIFNRCENELHRA